ncbi:hypothetical protein FRUB_02811 [Fimbriiglobus ruber]|uniref:Uncharacterized protein n=1 Tax=Fimbriiglobus ruber TaxID=1908690 RepID=A0A225DP88_9BACT|nr:hypothetical protein FRUB_02811 [Fimbriiglobus ruber]
MIRHTANDVMRLLAARDGGPMAGTRRPIQMKMAIIRAAIASARGELKRGS